jgi:hypothetical protein
MATFTSGLAQASMGSSIRTTVASFKNVLIFIFTSSLLI